MEDNNLIKVVVSEKYPTKTAIKKEKHHTKITSFQELIDNARNLSHVRVKRESPFVGEYFHHYIIIAISKVEPRVYSIIVGHYTTTLAIFTERSHGVGKFVKETFFIRLDGQNEDPHDLFRFDLGVELVEDTNYPKTADDIEHVINRLDERIGERMYEISSNNCEHAINYILTGVSLSEQADTIKCSKAFFIDFLNVLLIDCKEVGFRTALFVAAIGAIAGAFVRRAYVTIIVAAIVSLTIGNEPIDCGNRIGANIRTEAETRIKSAENMKYINYVVANNSIDTLVKLKGQLHTDFICALAKTLIRDAARKTCYSTALVYVGIETIFFLSFVFFNLLPRRKKQILKDRNLCRILFLNIVAGYGSILLTLCIAYRAFFHVERPSLSIFLTVFLGGIGFRYILICIAGQFYNFCCCAFCWNCYCCCSTGCVTFCNKECCWFRLITISFIILVLCILGILIYLLLTFAWADLQ
ncbi:uncharacterized protein LOC127724307 [Mytilus californianus]|uniref:uncharacterized protein LOC127724307 n=1 Tax=Mytilus californianus TaxID=6549 RepID=UPI002246C6ED|nr:uncharacterized protein LOC127724307 [Mytilus californianus]